MTSESFRGASGRLSSTSGRPPAKASRRPSVGAVFDIDISELQNITPSELVQGVPTNVDVVVNKGPVAYFDCAQKDQLVVVSLSGTSEGNKKALESAGVGAGAVLLRIDDLDENLTVERGLIELKKSRQSRRRLFFSLPLKDGTKSDSDGKIFEVSDIDMTLTDNSCNPAQEQKPEFNVAGAQENTTPATIVENTIPDFDYKNPQPKGDGKDTAADGIAEQTNEPYESEDPGTKTEAKGLLHEQSQSEAKVASHLNDEVDERPSENSSDILLEDLRLQHEQANKASKTTPSSPKAESKALVSGRQDSDFVYSSPPPSASRRRDGSTSQNSRSSVRTREKKERSASITSPPSPTQHLGRVTRASKEALDRHRKKRQRVSTKESSDTDTDQDASHHKTRKSEDGDYDINPGDLITVRADVSQFDRPVGSCFDPFWVAQVKSVIGERDGEMWYNVKYYDRNNQHVELRKHEKMDRRDLMEKIGAFAYYPVSGTNAYAEVEHQSICIVGFALTKAHKLRKDTINMTLKAIYRTELDPDSPDEATSSVADDATP